MNIVIEKETLRRIKGFTSIADGEVAGVARVNIRNGKPYVFGLKLLPEQEVTSGSVNLSNENLALFLAEEENSDEYKFLWHSHANMVACLSSIDDDCIEGFLETSPYIISCVSNKKGEMFIRFDGFYEGIRLSLQCRFYTEPERYDDLKEEFNLNIKETPIIIFKDGKLSEEIRNRYFPGFNYGLFGHEGVDIETFRDRTEKED